MDKDNLEKTKGIRLKGKRLEWWESTPGAADRIRGFIDGQLEQDSHINKIKKAPPELLEEFRKLIEQLKKHGGVNTKTNKKKIKEAESKIDTLLN
ncbi:hypothetical protein MWH25_08235 [Natroniella acetigena]|uniref:hypothetical protein n=1 Tax=Natroniella acetigena TaxID=52004 RepID=UPI00200A0BFD|nr:hypothetical protein [Natroniella acetigena]MCK8827731.1 hypothetical protein [Natroniella acetigena]